MLRYRIGSFRHLTGLSEATLRFYEQKGLLSPSRDEGNDYRSYGKEDLLKLVQITQYSNFGIPLGELPSQDHEVPLAEMGKLLGRRRQEIEALIGELYEKLGRIKLHEASFARFSQEDFAVSTANIGGIYRLFLTEASKAEDRATWKTAARWFSYMPYTHTTLRIPLGDIKGDSPGPFQVDFGLGLLERYFVQFGEQLLDHMQYSAPNTCVNGIVVVEDLEGITRKDILPFLDYMKAKGLMPLEDMFGWIVYSSREGGRQKYYLSLRMAVA